MSNDGKNIEDLFKGAFEGYKVNPSPSLWGSIYSKLRFRQLLQFGYTSFNIYYLGAIIAGSIITYSTIKFSNNNDSNLADINENSKMEVIENNLSNDNIIEKNFINNPDKSDGGADSKNNSLIAQNTEKKSNASNTLNTGKSDNNKKVETKETKPSSNKEVAKIQKPIVDFIPSINKGCKSLYVEFINKSERITWHKWDFGNSKTSFDENPVQLYDNPGEYIVKLKVKGHNNKYYSHIDTITVYEAPQAIFVIDELNSNIDNKTIYFINNSTNGSSYLWEFGDDNTSTEIEPIHIYNQSKSYLVKLKAWSDDGCMDSIVIRNNLLKANYYITFPNAFTPSIAGPRRPYYAPGDRLDEIFYPDYNGVAEFKIQIFSRAGILMFESKNIDYSWNGYFKDRIASPSVYIWEVSGKFENGETFMDNGTVTLIHKK